MSGSILLTGATGFLGKSLRSGLLLSGYRLICPGIDGRPRIDLTKPFDLANLGFINTVIHAAGKAHIVPKTDAEKREFFRINFEGTKNLCHALTNLKNVPKSFIFISSVGVYGVDEGENIDESHELRGTSPYAESKKSAELWLQQWALQNNVNLGVLRLPLLVGPNPPGNLGAMIDGIRSGKYLSIGNADARKSMVLTQDIAQIIPKIAEKGGVYNLTDGCHPTFGELELALCTALRKKRPFKIPYFVAKGLAKFGDIIGDRFPINSNKLTKISSTLTFDDAKARRELGWSPNSVLSKIREFV